MFQPITLEIHALFQKNVVSNFLQLLTDFENSFTAENSNELSAK